MTLLERAAAVLDELMEGLTVARPSLYLGLPRSVSPEAWACANQLGVFLDPKAEALSDLALRGLLAHELGHVLIAHHGGSWADVGDGDECERAADRVGALLVGDCYAHEALGWETGAPGASRWRAVSQGTAGQEDGASVLILGSIRELDARDPS